MIGQGLGVLVVAATLYILWQIRQILLLIFTAVVLATATNGLVRRVQQFNIPRGRAVFLSLSVLITVIVVFITLVVPPFVDQFQELIKLIPVGIAKIWQIIPQWIDQIIKWLPNNLTAPRDTLLIIKERIQSESINLDFSRFDLSDVSQQASPIVAQFINNFLAVFNNAIAVTLQLLLVTILALLLLAEPQAYRQTFISLFPSFYRRRADSILTECEIALENWFAGVILSCLFVGCASGLVLWKLGIDLALAHALLAGLLNFIPNIGPVLSVVFPLVVAIQDPSWRIGAIIFFYIVIQNLESYWITPLVMARQVSLLPALTLIAQIFFATAFGVLGLILALPLAVVVKVWFQELLVRDVLDPWDHRQETLKVHMVRPDRDRPW